jgi:gliding motility-associated-like protein
LTQTITSWIWQFGDGNSSNLASPVHTYTSAGSFVAKLYYITDKGCVSDTAERVPIIHPYPVVNAGPDLFVLEGGQATIAATATGSSNYVYRWSPVTDLNNPNTLQPVTKPTVDRTYVLTVTGAGGCSSSDDVFVKVLLAPVIPNVFSPNGDGINDVWNIRYLNSYIGASVKVFDRYGKMIFESIGYNTPWDGKKAGKELPVGVYYYIIDPKNGRKAMSGSVTILR